MEKPGYFERYASEIASNGYEIIEILPGKKFTTRDDWGKAGLTQEEIEAFIAGGKGRFGVGILTRKTPFIDLDCYDKSVIAHMTGFIKEIAGLGPMRVGKSPKCGFLYRADAPFSKIKSDDYEHDSDERQRLEVLGDGQQFVAAAIHPETLKPYKWTDGNPARVETWELPLLTAEMALEIAAEFDRLVVALGWKLKSKNTSLATSGRRLTAADDDFIDVKSVCGLSIEEVREKLFKVPNDGVTGEQDYDTWSQIGMAVYHETDGSEEGFDLWDEWSAQSGKNGQKGTNNRAKWKSFDANGKGREPITFRFVLKLVADTVEAEIEDKVRDLRQRVAAAETTADLRDVLAAFKHVNVAANPLVFESCVDEIRKRYRKLENSPIAAAKVKELIRFEDKERTNTPKWLEPFCYLVAGDEYLNRETGARVKPRAFDTAFARERLTKRDILEGLSKPSIPASEFAMNLVRIPKFQDARYMPTEDADFWLDGQHYANTYSTALIPELPEKLTAAQKEVVRRVLHHFDILIPDDRDRTLFLDWLAYVVQTNDRPNWAVMLQGVEGDGKTWIAQMMGAVLGAGNTRPVDADRLKEQFNGWAEGAQLLAFEEVRLPHTSAREIMDKIKPLITNRSIMVNRKGRDSYTAPNTAAVLILTNYRDALQLSAGDTRYFPIFGRFATKADKEAYFRDNAGEHWTGLRDYYARLYAAIDSHPGAIRQMFKERKLSAEFSAKSRAPESSVKADMIQASKSSFEEAMDAAMADNPFACDLKSELLNATRLVDIITDGLEAGEFLPKTTTVNRTLTNMGYTFVGRVWHGGRNCRYWSRCPDRFRADPISAIHHIYADEL